MKAMLAVATLDSHGSHGSLGNQCSPPACGMSTGVIQPAAGLERQRGKTTKLEVADAFIANLRAKGDVAIDEEGFVESIREHFASLPSR